MCIFLVAKKSCKMSALASLVESGVFLGLGIQRFSDLGFKVDNWKQNVVYLK